MTTITIPKDIGNNKSLVAVPRKIYTEFLAWQKKIKSERTFMPTAAKRKAITRGRKELKTGNYIDLAQSNYIRNTHSRYVCVYL